MSTATLRCCHCKTRFPREEARKLPVGNFCSYAHVIDYAAANGAKALQNAKDAKRKAYKAETKAMRVTLNQDSHKWQTAETQRAFNELVRLLDVDMPCIVHGMHLCGHESGWHAGHYLTVASQPALRFDLRNCFKQCGRSNKGDAKYLANNDSIRTQFEYGIATMHSSELLSWLKGPHSAAKLSCQQLADMRAEFRAEISRIKKGQPPSRDWRKVQQESAAA